MSSLAIEALANLIRMRSRCVRVVIRLEYGDGNTLSIASDASKKDAPACTST